MDIKLSKSFNTVETNYKILVFDFENKTIGGNQIVKQAKEYLNFLKIPKFISVLLFKYLFLYFLYYLRYWIAKPGVLVSKCLCGSKVYSAIHSSELNQMSNRNSWALSGKM